jgi:hypothetical protein
MLKVDGVVTYVESKVSERTGKPYAMVSIEGLFCFADANALPARGDHIIGAVQANSSGDGADRKTSFNLFSWQKSSNGNGHG